MSKKFKAVIGTDEDGNMVSVENKDINTFTKRAARADEDHIVCVNDNGEGILVPSSEYVSTGDSIPHGTVTMYYGRYAPPGWALCDGTNGTPDLRGRFPVGYGDKGNGVSGDVWDANYTIIGRTGGLKEVVLSSDQMPKHKHAVRDQWRSGTQSDSGDRYRRVFYNGGNNLRYVDEY